MDLVRQPLVRQIRAAKFETARERPGCDEGLRIDVATPLAAVFGSGLFSDVC